MRRSLFSIALACGLLAGCGAEVAGSAATVGKLQTTQAEQATAQQDRIVKGVGTALKAGEAAASAAAGP